MHLVSLVPHHTSVATCLTLPCCSALKTLPSILRRETATVQWQTSITIKICHIDILLRMNQRQIGVQPFIIGLKTTTLERCWFQSNISGSFEVRHSDALTQGYIVKSYAIAYSTLHQYLDSQHKLIKSDIQYFFPLQSNHILWVCETLHV